MRVGRRGGKGWPDRLMRQGRTLAESSGAKVISLSRGRGNYPSRRLYEKLGIELDEEFCTYSLKLD